MMWPARQATYILRGFVCHTARVTLLVLILFALSVGPTSSEHSKIKLRKIRQKSSFASQTSWFYKKPKSLPNDSNLLTISGHFQQRMEALCLRYNRPSAQRRQMIKREPALWSEGEGVPGLACLLCVPAGRVGKAWLLSLTAERKRSLETNYEDEETTTQL